MKGHTSSAWHKFEVLENTHGPHGAKFNASLIPLFVFLWLFMMSQNSDSQYQRMVSHIVAKACLGGSGRCSGGGQGGVRRVSIILYL